MDVSIKHLLINNYGAFKMTGYKHKKGKKKGHVVCMGKVPSVYLTWVDTE
jgi:hypothetical protein